MLYTTVISTPIGLLYINGTADAICSIFFEDEPVTDDKRGHQSDMPPLLQEAQAQLTAYFARQLQVFDLPLQCKGTDFQQRVWRELQNVGYGKTVSYLYIAQQLGDTKAVRAVGTANGSNPIPIIVPCHRIIGSNGTLTGYAGGLWRKQWLLEHEAAGTTLTLF